jgi:hypothetical protein
MGYTTEFTGQFDLNRQMDSFTIWDKLHEWSENPKNNPINGYCQWEFTDDRKHIKWDGNEKFYEYQEWLQIIIDQLLLPNNYTLTGQVEFQGEEVDDHGFLYIENNKVLIRKTALRGFKCPHCHEFIKLNEKGEPEESS